MPNLEEEKRQAAMEAVKLVSDGMIVGLGTGSTVKYFLDGLAKKVQEGLKITGIPTSLRTEEIARNNHILLDLGVDKIDIDVDGTDLVGVDGTLIKGGGGALFREKVVAYSSRYVVIIADSTKYRKTLGKDLTVPVEILSFMHAATLRRLSELGSSVTLRNNGKFITDNGNMVADCHFDNITDFAELDSAMKSIAGVIETGIFPETADLLIYVENGLVMKKEF